MLFLQLIDYQSITCTTIYIIPKIFVSIRSEAYTNILDSTKLQLDDYSTQIHYSESDIYQIFLKNIVATQDSHVVLPKINDISRLTGFSKIPHSFIENITGNKQEEDFFKFVYRHTYRRPREIMEMGQQIVSIPPSERTIERVREAVNKVSYKLFDQLKTEIIPYFDDEVFMEFCKKIKKNVVTYENALEIYNEILETLGFDSVFSYFYRLGLIGYVDTNYNGDMNQKFLPVGQFSLANESIPEYKYFVLHPSINNEMKRYHQNDFYNQHNIIGYNYPFKPTQNIKRLKHIHFGLDRDSLAIVLPELNKSKCLCIVQFPNHEWSDLEDYEKILFNYNTGERIEFSIFRDNLITSRKKKVENQYGDCEPLILYTSDTEIIKKYILESDTISFSVFPKDLFTQLDFNLSNKYIYLQQRVYNQQKLDEINATLAKVNGVCHFVIVDRFLYSKDFIRKESGNLRLELSMESDGTFICPERPSYTMRPSKVVIRTKNEKEFKYYIQRQNRLVEGVYQLFKILKQNGLNPSSSKVAEDIFNVFIHTQVHAIKNNIDIDTLINIFNGDSESVIFNNLVEFGRKTVKRTSALSKSYTYFTNLYPVELAKENGFFPSDSDFYKFIPDSIFINSCSVIMELYEILNIQPIDSFKSVFISYSFKDSEFARNLSNFLKLNGVRVFLFEMENLHKPLKSIMAEEILNYDKVIFIASKHSLESKGCHFELTKCREKYSKNWAEGQILIPIKIDNYILDVEKYQIPKEYSEEYWSNIELVRQNNIISYEDFVNLSNCIEFQKQIKKLIKDSLKKTAKG